MTAAVRFLVFASLIASLSGCTVAYRHPDYEFNSPEDQQNFDKDREACASLSDRQRCVDLKEKASMICESDGKGSHSCRDFVPRQCSVDTPEQCMRRKGWRKADVNGNYLE